MDDDMESEFKSHISDYNTRDRMHQEEEEKVPNISKTRIGDIDKSSILHNSNFDQASLEDGTEGFGDLIDVQKNGDSRNQMKFQTEQIRGGHIRENSFKDIAGIENRNFDMGYQDS